MSNKNKTNSEDKNISVNNAVKDDGELKTEEPAKIAASENKADKADKADKAKQSRTKTSTGKGITFILFIVMFVAGSLAAYYFWDLLQRQNKQMKRQDNAISSLRNELDTLSQNTSSKTAAQALLIQQIDEKILQTEKISQQAIAVVNRTQRDWALAETDYLLRLAHQRIEVARDIGGAIAALKGADARLEQLADLSLFKIRKQLVKDIAGLNAIHQADVNGISLNIDQVIMYLSDLPFKSVEDEIKTQMPQQEAESVEAEGQTFVDSVLETVKQIGDIKVHQRSIEMASGAEQQAQIEQLLRTYLLSARLAALRFNQVQFLHEIQQASEILHLHYDEKDNRVSQLKATLSDYSALQLSPDLPELTKAWSLLQKEMQIKLKSTNESDGEVEVKK